MKEYFLDSLSLHSPNFNTLNIPQTKLLPKAEKHLIFLQMHLSNSTQPDSEYFEVCSSISTICVIFARI